MPISSDFTATLFCAVCCSTIEVEALDLVDGWLDTECGGCETRMKVCVDPEKIARSAISG